MKILFRLKPFHQRGLAFLFALCVIGSQSVRAQTNASARIAPPSLRYGIVYEVFPRQFSPGGNLNGVTARLDDLKDLGVSILWLMPIHPIGEKLRKGSYGSPYSVRDYTAINPDYGTKEDLKHLVAEAHQRGLKVILDVVLLHTAWDNVLMAHPEFYKHNAAGKIVPPMPEWTDVAGLNYENPELRSYLKNMLVQWVNETDIDGFRCDTASMIPTSFWEEAAAAIRQAKPDVIMLAEADKPELLTNAFDIDYAWPLLNTLRNVMEKSAPASDIQRTWENDVKRYPKGSLRLSMSDNHDQTRAVSSFGVSGALAASALMFTLDGVPLLYNGMEVGDSSESGGDALFEKVPIRWQPKGRPPLPDIYRDLIKLRKQYAAFRNGDVQWIHNSDQNDLITFLRTDGKDEFLVTINFSSRRVHGKIDLENSEDFAPVKITGIKKSDNQLPGLDLNGFEWCIYHRKASLASVK